MVREQRILEKLKQVMGSALSRFHTNDPLGLSAGFLTLGATKGKVILRRMPTQWD